MSMAVHPSVPCEVPVSDAGTVNARRADPSTATGSAAASSDVVPAGTVTTDFFTAFAVGDLK